MANSSVSCVISLLRNIETRDSCISIVTLEKKKREKESKGRRRVTRSRTENVGNSNLRVETSKNDSRVNFVIETLHSETRTLDGHLFRSLPQYRRVSYQPCMYTNLHVQRGSFDASNKK